MKRPRNGHSGSANPNPVCRSDPEYRSIPPTLGIDTQDRSERLRGRKKEKRGMWIWIQPEEKKVKRASVSRHRAPLLDRVGVHPMIYLPRALLRTCPDV